MKYCTNELCGENKIDTEEPKYCPRCGFDELNTTFQSLLEESIFHGMVAFPLIYGIYSGAQNNSIIESVTDPVNMGLTIGVSTIPFVREIPRRIRNYLKTWDRNLTYTVKQLS